MVSAVSTQDREDRTAKLASVRQTLVQLQKEFSTLFPNWKKDQADYEQKKNACEASKSLPWTWAACSARNLLTDELTTAKQAAEATDSKMNQLIRRVADQLAQATGKNYYFGGDLAPGIWEALVEPSKGIPSFLDKELTATP